jgi:hypothetical protein
MARKCGRKRKYDESSETYAKTNGHCDEKDGDDYFSM